MDDLLMPDLRDEFRLARRLLGEGPGPVHMMGIAGVGMAGVAVQLQARGWTVSGCDAGSGRVAAWLEGRGIRVLQGHDPAHVKGDECFVVRSPAVPAGDPEVLRARRAGIPVLVRGVVLPALLADGLSIAVAGTHGKTTTTAMIAHVLRMCGVDASFCIGGEADGLGGVAGVGTSGVCVAEADESDGTLSLYAAEIGVITNIEMDHVDYFQREDILDACFADFAGQVRRRLVYCADDARAGALGSRSRLGWGYGFSAAARLRGAGLWERGPAAGCEVWRDGARLGSLSLAVPGATNVLDALAAVAVGLELGLPFSQVAAALATFRAVRRRFDVRAQARGITVISDYAHHPTEIRALLRQARGMGGRRVLAVFQPHRYTRTAALGADFPAAFSGLDALWLVPVYAASEPPLAGGASEDLLAHFQRDGGVPTQLSHSLLEAWEHIRNKWREGDVLLVVGAGDVDAIATWAARELSAASA